MSDKNTDHYQSALLEEIRHDIKTVLEGQQSLVPISRDVSQLKDDMREVKTRLTSVEVAVTDLSKQHCRLDGRVTKLEEAAA